MAEAGRRLGLDGTYIARSYIEQVHPRILFVTQLSIPWFFPLSGIGFLHLTHLQHYLCRFALLRFLLVGTTQHLSG